MHVNGIWDEYVGGSQRYQQALEGALLAVQKGFSREGHYLFEFIQNAEDARARTFHCGVDGQAVTIRNDGVPFEAKDVESLCNVGHSTKNPEGYIGYLGVGFKSAFLIADDVEVHSGPYHFAFRHEDKRLDFPWQVAPRWLSPVEILDPWHTEFRINDREKGLAKRIAQEMGRESLNPRILLFLESLEQLVLEDKNEGQRRVVRRVALGNGLYNLHESTSEGDSSETWMVFSSGPLKVPNDVRDDWFTKNWNRDEAQHRAVSIAFKLTETGELEEIRGTLHMGVFSYLPVKEERTRLKFLVHSDFLTSVGRTRLQEEAPWNKWLASEVLNLVKQKGDDLLQHPQRRKNAFVVLWPQKSDDTDFFAEHVEHPLRQHLREEAELPAYDGSYVKSSDGLQVEDSQMWEVVGPAELERLYGKRPLKQDVQIPFDETGRAIVEKAPGLFGSTRNPGFVSSREGQTLLSEKAKKGEIAFFQSLYQKMGSLWLSPQSYRRSPLAYSAIILTNGLELAQPSDKVFFRPETLPPGIAGQFQFVHSELARDDDARRFLELIGVQTLPESTIKQKLSEDLIPEIQKSWPSFSEKERYKWLIDLKGMVERQEISSSVLGFVTVPTKSGKWLPPKDILFPEEYSPKYHIETLTNHGLLDDASIEFVTSDLAKSSGTSESWQRFLSDLGTGVSDRDSRLIRWTARVGVLMARRYEKKHQREIVKEVTESERGVSDPGYDLVSKGQGEERFIEAKGTRGSGDFTLRPTTLREMFTGTNRGQFFVYVTSDALAKPRLHIIKADQLTPEMMFSGEIQLDIGKVPVAEEVNYEVL